MYFKKESCEVLFKKHFQALESVRFTPREIDIAACLANDNLQSKKIASVLGISTKTIDNYILDIIGKIGPTYNYRYQIVEFFRKTDKFSLLKNEYFTSLKRRIIFEKNLLLLQKENRNHTSYLTSALSGKNPMHHSILKDLIKGLKSAGCLYETEKISEQSLHIKVELLEATADAVLFVKSSPKPSSQLETIKLELTDYYQMLFELLCALNLSEKISAIAKSCLEELEAIEDPAPHFIPREKKSVKNQAKKYLPYLLGVCFILASYAGYKIKDDISKKRISCSNLSASTKENLLYRSQKFCSIDQILNKQKGIKSISLLGPGGAGKTTLAIQYAKQLNAEIIWKINARDKHTILRSFEGFLYNVATSGNYAQEIKFIEGITDPELKKQATLNTLQKILKAAPGWVLIFDNVEDMTLAQEFLPNDVASWGEGVLILTSRDQNIQFNLAFPKSLPVGELQDSEQRNLFFKTLGNQKLNVENADEIDELLSKIPSYPLDTILTASYLRSSNMAVSKYLQNILTKQEIYSDYQKLLLGSIGSYSETRYSIITLSLKKLIQKNKEFEKFLLFISLIDNHRIPIAFLELISDKPTVDSFLYYLNKYALITMKENVQSLQTFTLHDTTHATIKNNLKDHYPKNVVRQKIEEFAALISEKMNASIMEETVLPEIKLYVDHFYSFFKNATIEDSMVRQDIMTDIARANFYVGDYPKAQLFIDKSYELYKKERKNRSKGRLGDVRFLSFLCDHYGSAMRRGDLKKDIKLLERLSLLLKEALRNTPKDQEQSFVRFYIYDALNYTHLGYIANSLERLKLMKNHLEKHPDGEALEEVDFFKVHKECMQYFAKSYKLVENMREAAKKSSLAKLYAFGKHYAGIPMALTGNRKGLLLALEAHEEYKKIYSENNIRIGWSHRGLAHCYQGLGEIPNSAKNYKEAADIYEKHYSRQNSIVILLINEYTYCLLRMGKFDEAEKYIEGNARFAEKSNDYNKVILQYLQIVLCNERIKRSINVSQNIKTRTMLAEQLRQRLNSGAY